MKKSGIITDNRRHRTHIRRDRYLSQLVNEAVGLKLSTQMRSPLNQDIADVTEYDIEKSKNAQRKDLNSSAVQTSIEKDQKTNTTENRNIFSNMKKHQQRSSKMAISQATSPINSRPILPEINTEDSKFQQSTATLNQSFLTPTLKQANFMIGVLHQGRYSVERTNNIIDEATRSDVQHLLASEQSMRETAELFQRSKKVSEDRRLLQQGKPTIGRNKQISFSTEKHLMKPLNLSQQILSETTKNIVSGSYKFDPNKSSNFASPIGTPGSNVQSKSSVRNIKSLKDKLIRPYFLDKIDSLLKQSNLSNSFSTDIQSARKQKIKEHDQLEQEIKDIELRIRNRKKEIEKCLQEKQSIKGSINQQSTLHTKLSSQVLNMSKMSKSHNMNEDSLNMDNQQTQYNKSGGVEVMQNSVATSDTNTPQTKNKGKEIHQIYKLYFENDLKAVKDRAQEQLSTYRSKQDCQQSNLEELRAENFQLAKTVKRYRDMLNDPNLQKITHPHKNNIQGLFKHKETLMMQEDVLSQEANSINIDNIEDINNHVYKFDDNKGLTSRQGQHLSGSNFSMNNAAPAFVEIIKIEKFSMTWLSLHKLAKPLELLIGVMQEIKNIFKPTKCTLFILSKTLQQKIFKSKDKNRHFKRLMMGSHLIYALFAVEDDFSGPIFKTPEEAEQCIRSQQVLMIPFKRQGENELHFCLQLEVDLSKEQEEMQQMRKFKSRKKIPMHLSKGWNYNDLNLAKIIIEFFTLRLEIQVMGMQMIEKNEKVSEIIRFASDICRRKTYRHLIKGVKRHICRLFGFSEVGILFYDGKLNELFTVSTDVDTNPAMPTQSKQTQPLAKHSKFKTRPDPQRISKLMKKIMQPILDEIKIKIEEELIFPDDQVVKFPHTVGITGEMFKTCGVFYSNNQKIEPNNETKPKNMLAKFAKDLKSTGKSLASTFSKRKESAPFNSDVDNFMGVKNINNYLITSLNDYDESNKLYSVGIMQFFNKERSITLEDVERIKNIQLFLGAAVTRVKIITASLTVLVGLSMIMEDSMNDIKNLETDIVNQFNDSISMMIPLETLKKHLDNYSNELGYQL